MTTLTPQLIWINRTLPISEQCFYIQNAAIHIHVYHSEYQEESFFQCGQCSVQWNRLITVHHEVEYPSSWFNKGSVFVPNVAPHTTHVTSPAEIFGYHSWKRTVEWTVRATVFMGLEELWSRYKFTPFLVILATHLNFLNDILQKPAPGLWELLSTGWALIHFLSAAVAYVVAILTHRNWWRHVLLTYRTPEFFQNLPRGDVHVFAAGSTHTNLWKQKGNVTITSTPMYTARI